MYPIVNRSTNNIIAALDMGSNSFHLLIVKIDNDKFTVIEKGKVRVRLAAYIDENNVLLEEGMERGLQCLAEFVNKLQDVSPSNIRIVATQALRQATNAAEFIARAKLITPIPIDIISGSEESRLIYCGVNQNFSKEGRKLVIDIGGGSTEISIGDDFPPLLTESHKMGCISFSKQYFPDDSISKQLFNTAVQNVHSLLTTYLPDYKHLGWQHVIGCSGTIKAIREVLIGLGYTDGLISKARLKELVSLVTKYSNFEQLDFKGLSNERRPVFVAGLAILYGVFETLEIKNLVFSEAALREGVLYELRENLKQRRIRQTVVKELAQKYQINRQDAAGLQEITQLLYQQWTQQNPHLVEVKLEELLHWAAYLHQIGAFISSTAFHKHSAYILKHSEMPSFSREQQIILTNLVRLQRKNIKLDKLSSVYTIKKSILFPLLLILRLGLILQPACKLKSALSKDITLTTNSEIWTLTLNKEFSAKNPQVLEDLAQEQHYWQVFNSFKLKLNKS